MHSAPGAKIKASRTWPRTMELGGRQQGRRGRAERRQPPIRARKCYPCARVAHLFHAIARVLMATAAEETGVDYDEFSQKSAVLGLAAYATRLFLSKDTEYAIQELQALTLRSTRLRQKRRRGRQAPRVSIKPRPRWGPSGREGA